MTYGKNLVQNLDAYCKLDFSAVASILVHDGVAMKDLWIRCICVEKMAQDGAD